MQDSIFHVKVSSFAVFDALTERYGKKIFIASAMKEVENNDLEFIQAAKYIENALREYSRVSTPKDADIIIRVAYGIGDPQRNYDNVITSSGYSYPVGWMWFTVPPQTKTIATTTYQRNLILEAYWLKGNESKTPIWKTTATSEGSISDIHTVLPYMIAASRGYIGISSGRQIDVRYNTNNPDWMALILSILNGPQPENFVGIGTQIEMKDDKVTISNVYPNTPASKAGLTPGLIINKIDGISTKGMKLEECVSMIRGPVDSNVILELFNPDNNSIMTANLIRKPIQTVK